MRFALLALIAGLVLGAAARAEPSDSCVVVDKTFDVLVAEFIQAWDQPQEEFCQFKRTLVLNSMIADDMRRSADRYNLKIQSLKLGYADQPLPIGFLLASFQEVWFSRFIDAVLELEMNKTKSVSRKLVLSVGGLAAVMLAVPHVKQYSSRTLRILRTLGENLFRKRPIIFGASSVLPQRKRLNISNDEKGEVQFVLPPLSDAKKLEALDPRTDQIFVQDLNRKLGIVGGGVIAGWVPGHFVSMAVKHYAPTWAKFFAQSKWPLTKPAQIFSPGMLAGIPVTLVLSEWAAREFTELDSQRQYKAQREKLQALLTELRVAIGKGIEREIWMAAEKIRHELWLTTYLLTQETDAAIEDAAESVSRGMRSALAVCNTSSARVLRRERQRFQSLVTSAIETNRRALQASVGLALTTNEALATMPHPLMETLTDFTSKLIMRGNWLLEPVEVGTFDWDDIVEPFQDFQPQACVSEPGFYP